MWWCFRRPPVLVALLHELLNEQAFDSLADLTAELKHRAARLRIAYDSSRISSALHAVEQSRPLVQPTVRHRPDPPADPPPITRDEAIDFLARLWALKARRR